MLPSKLFTEGAREALIATGLDESVRARFEALVIWEMKSGIITAGEVRLICIGPNWLEFTFNDRKQVVDVRLAAPPEGEGGPSII